jgi:excisionase family DNA binding protein
MNPSLQGDAAPSLNKLAYTLDEVAELSGHCRSSLYELINGGKLRAVKSGRRTLILADDLRSWMEAFTPVEPRRAGSKERQPG